MAGKPQDEDAAAMGRLREGDDLALNEIMGRWAPRVSSFLARALGNQADALDLSQETFVAVYRARGSYRPEAPFASWLFGIAANLARQRLRWRKRHPEVSLGEEGVPEAAAGGGDPAEAAGRRERAAAVREAVLALPEELRETVILSVYEDLPQAEIAAAVGCSVKAVETRLYRARGQLRRSLGRWLAG